MRTKRLASLALAVIFSAMALTGCGSTPSGSLGSSNNDGYAEGRMGDTMHTYFFDYTVNSAYICDTYEGYTPTDSDKELVVTEITVKNTHNESIEMYDSDFQIQWGDDENLDAYEYPITLNLKSGETVGENMLPDVYKMSVNENRTGIHFPCTSAPKKNNIKKENRSTRFSFFMLGTLFISVHVLTHRRLLKFQLPFWKQG